MFVARCDSDVFPPRHSTEGSHLTTEGLPVKEIVFARTHITNDGFKKFVELHEGSQPSRFQIIENPFLDDALLDILVAYEGLEYVDFGSRSNITRKGVNQFYVDYYKKHKVMLNLVHGL